MLKIIELFAGIDSQIQALKNLNIGHEVIGISEIDKWAIKAYEQMHGKVNNFGDITKIEGLPYCDLLTYSFPCFLKNTLVLTLNGYKNIQDIKINDVVLTHINRYNKVVNVFINKTNEIYEIKSMSSESIFSTKNHPFYIREKYKKWNNHKRCYDRLFKSPEWKTANNLNKNTYLGIAINKEIQLPSWDGCFFYWRDGRSPRKSNRLKSDFIKKEFWWILGRYLGDGWIRQQGGIIICCKECEIKDISERLNILNYKYSIVKDLTIYKIHIAFKELSEYLLQFGKGAKYKHLTKDIFNLPVNLLEQVIIGYHSADGCYSNNIYKITSISRELIYGIAQCISKVYNRPYSIYKTIRKKECVIQGRKVNQNNTYTITWHEKRKQDRAFYDNGYCWFPINEIKIIKKQENVYNFEVETDNSYTVNNVIVHNCQDLSIAGKQAGIKQGTRGGLLYEVERLLNGMTEKPKYLLLENVKNLISQKFYPDYEKWLNRLSQFGYVNYSILLNAKDYGIPQNRERVFCVSIRKDIDKFFWKPEKEKLKLKLKDFIPNCEYVFDRNYFNARQRRGDKCEFFKYIPCIVKSHPNKNIWINNEREITGKELLLFMGFKKNQIKKIHGISNNIISSLAGNSIVVNVLEKIFKNLLDK